MTQLSFIFFGSFNVKFGDEPITRYRSDKVRALLAYLAVTGQSHSRDMLGTLLWPDQSQGTARAYLRRELARLRELLGKTSFIADRETLALNSEAGLWVDVVQFQQHLATVQQCGHGRAQ